MLVSSNLSLPPWLQALLSEKFFNACVIHEGARKNEKNIFCLDCCVSICPHCLSPHGSHRLLQIRRYVYNDVLRLDDAQKLFDSAFVQSYTTNSAKVIFLNQRPLPRPGSIRGNICSRCDRGLQCPYLFCSISCKVDYILRTEGVGGLSSFLYDCKFLPLSEPASDDGLMAPVSLIAKTSSSSGGYGDGGVPCRTLACTAATTETVRKKRSSLSNSCRTMFPRDTEISANLMNRRKKAPNRAPLY
ncbi:PLATZ TRANSCRIPTION FACTOR FAMILY PROTEIN [Salix purpurea]|uniref:PLATZ TRANSCRIPTION FACTOR FAMILY PROTEIN n=1 Tax=Salix purpurea TaxID=77065 RepID=A0A9Q0PDB2_SALPP|nr:PLATZ TRANSCRIPTION FACTOR FAMILY PROTEIN [Salix purpurea]